MHTSRFDLANITHSSYVGWSNTTSNTNSLPFLKQSIILYLSILVKLIHLNKLRHCTQWRLIRILLDDTTRRWRHLTWRNKLVVYYLLNFITSVQITHTHVLSVALKCRQIQLRLHPSTTESIGDLKWDVKNGVYFTVFQSKVYKYIYIFM